MKGMIDFCTKVTDKMRKMYEDLLGPTIVTQTLDFEVYAGQLERAYTWVNAKKACEALGDGWRLPTRSEIVLLYLVKGDLGGIRPETFWTSEEYRYSYAYSLTIGDYNTCLRTHLKEREYLHVVPVRDV